MAKKDKKNTSAEVSETSEKEKKSKKAEESVTEEKKDKKKSEKPEKKEPNKVAKWFKDLKIEFKKVVWPSKKTVFDNTGIVLAVVVASAVLVGLLDTGFLALMRLIYQQG
ncbi:MAG: preprotein translocase subunit SecE [Ruminococcus sp.]|nr:preprotein translocase subunit SecE [Ruminococcus sp.]